VKVNVNEGEEGGDMGLIDFQHVENSLRRLDFITRSAAIEIYHIVNLMLFGKIVITFSEVREGERK
jgi:hypothetical protein